MIRLNNLIFIFFIYSFAGWFMESVGGILKEKKFINRGFLIGPYCPVYGFGVVGITLLLTKYQNDISTLFVLTTVTCGILEYFTSYSMEKLFHARWWDYHNMRFNINGRICLETLVPFGIVGTLIVSYLNPVLYSLFNNIPNNIMNICSIGLVCLFILDFIISFCIIASFKDTIYGKKDNTEEISNKVKEKTEELGEKVKDKAENTFMQIESNATVFSRNIKVRSLKIERKMKYTGKRFYQKTTMPIKDLANRFKMRTYTIRTSIQERKEKIDKQIKNTQEELSKQIIENFKKRSKLSKRLMDAFPKISIKLTKDNNNQLKK